MVYLQCSCFDQFSENPDLNPADIIPDGRYNHIYQVQERLSFLRFLLKVSFVAQRQIIDIDVNL